MSALNHYTPDSTETFQVSENKEITDLKNWIKTSGATMTSSEKITTLETTSFSMTKEMTKFLEQQWTKEHLASGAEKICEKIIYERKVFQGQYSNISLEIKKVKEIPWGEAVVDSCLWKNAPSDFKALSFFQKIDLIALVRARSQVEMEEVGISSKTSLSFQQRFSSIREKLGKDVDAQFSWDNAKNMWIIKSTLSEYWLTPEEQETFKQYLKILEKAPKGVNEAKFGWWALKLWALILAAAAWMVFQSKVLSPIWESIGPVVSPIELKPLQWEKTEFHKWKIDELIDSKDRITQKAAFSLTGGVFIPVVDTDVERINKDDNLLEQGRKILKGTSQIVAGNIANKVQGYERTITLEGQLTIIYDLSKKRTVLSEDGKTYTIILPMPIIKVMDDKHTVDVESSKDPTFNFKTARDKQLLQAEENLKKKMRDAIIQQAYQDIKFYDQAILNSRILLQDETQADLKEIGWDGTVRVEMENSEWKQNEKSVETSVSESPNQKVTIQKGNVLLNEQETKIEKK